MMNICRLCCVKIVKKRKLNIHNLFLDILKSVFSTKDIERNEIKTKKLLHYVNCKFIINSLFKVN